MAQMMVASGRTFRWFCDISAEPVVELAKDLSTGEIYVKNPEDHKYPLGQDGPGRQLENELPLRASTLKDDSWVSAVQVRQAQDADTTQMYALTARKCTCANDPAQYLGMDYYCMQPYTHCAIPSWWGGAENLTPGCVNRPKRERFVRGVWPVVVVWFSLLITCFLCTKPGHMVYDYALGLCCPCWTNWVANRMLRRDPDRANHLIRQYWRRRRRALERRYFLMIAERRARGEVDDDDEAEREVDDSTSDLFPPTELALKTRIFNRSDEEAALVADDTLSDEDSDLGDEAACTICLGVIEDGARVGALACDHIFHVECLKPWLARRNVCPLCQMENAATPRCRPRAESVPTDATTDEEESQNQERAAEPAAEPATADDDSTWPEWRHRFRSYPLAMAMARHQQGGSQGGTPRGRNS